MQKTPKVNFGCIRLLKNGFSQMGTVLRDRRDTKKETSKTGLILTQELTQELSNNKRERIFQMKNALCVTNEIFKVRPIQIIGRSSPGGR